MPASRSTGSRSRRLLAASMLGVGALVQPRARADEHWSASPRLTTEVVVAGEAAGDPPAGDHLPTGPDGAPIPAPGRNRRRRRWFRRRA